jgi:tight adherence protein C
VGDEFDQLLAEPFLTRVVRPIAGRVLGLVSGLLPGNYREGPEPSSSTPAWPAKYRAEEIITLQIVLGAVVGFFLALGLVLSGVLDGNVGILLLVLLPVLGAQAAPLVAGPQGRGAPWTSIRRDLPDTLDLLAISVEAGMGFEGALGVVCDNFDSPLSDEFARTLREMELGLPRREALHNLKRRTEVPELSNFVLTLTQADALGMPIGRVLKTQPARCASSAASGLGRRPPSCR